jgi:excinuclease ABC subunit C
VKEFMLNVNSLPTEPGCYQFKDEFGKVIYVGKAKNLRKRVSSYVKNDKLDIKSQNLVKSIESVEYIVTDTEVEAYILENTLIKQYQPRFNIRLKDAKNFAYIQLTSEEYPRLLIARTKKGTGKFYGPFVSYHERDYILHFLRKTFMIRTCKRMPRKPCLRYYIQLCSAPCVGYISLKEYNKRINNVKLILSGREKQLLKTMQREMKLYSDKALYEQAMMLRNQIIALEHLNERQNIDRQRKYDEDIINYQIKDGKVYLLLFNIYKGTLSNKNEFVFDDNNDFLEEFLIQYYSEYPVPKEIILPKKMDKSLSSFLELKRGSKVFLTVPVKGAKKQLLELVKKNIELTFFADIEKVDVLRKQLNLKDTPSVIECFDISHLSGTSTVGSMVQFRNGKSDKNKYRRFRIRTVEGIDDTAAISEVVKRRYYRLLVEDSEFPDLIIIDGGRGQLNFALKELTKLDVKIPIISIAKQFEEIYIPGNSNPLILKKNDKALRFIQEIRDEAHRFALKYNRLLREKELIA